MTSDETYRRAFEELDQTVDEANELKRAIDALHVDLSQGIGDMVTSLIKLADLTAKMAAKVDLASHRNKICDLMMAEREDRRRRERGG